MTALWLTEVDVARRAIVMRAVKIALMEAGVEASKAMSEAERAVRTVAAGRGPVGLVIDDGHTVAPGTAGRALAKLEAALSGGHEDAAKAHLDDFQPPPRETVEAAKAAPQVEVPSEFPRGSVEWIEAEFQKATPENFAPSPEARKCALMLMALTNGNVQAAWFQAKQFARNSGHLDLWVEVSHVLGETFTWPGPST